MFSNNEMEVHTMNSNLKLWQLRVPIGNLASDEDAIAARRRALAEALRGGEDVVVTPSGQVEFQAEAMGHTAIQVPDGKLAQGGE